MATLSSSDDSPISAPSTSLSLPSQRARMDPSRCPATRSVDDALGGCLHRVLADLGASGDEGEVTRFASLGADHRRPVIAAVGVGELNGSGASDEVLRKAAGRPSGRSPATPGRIRASGGRRRWCRRRRCATGRVLGEAAPSGQGVRSRTSLSSAEPRSPRSRREPSSPTPSRLARELGNLPANLLPPAGLADRAVAAEAAYLRCRDHRAGRGGAGRAGLRRDHRRRSGSVNPPRLVRLSGSPGRDA